MTRIELIDHLWDVVLARIERNGAGDSFAIAAACVERLEELGLVSLADDEDNETEDAE